MHRIYLAIGVCSVLLLLTAGFVAFTKNRLGVLTSKEVGRSIAGLTALEIGTILCWCTAFVIGGGPDGRFMSSGALLNGGLCLVVMFLVVLFSLRLLSLPLLFTSLFLAPAVLVIVGQFVKIWVVTIAGFTLPPLCLVVVVGCWVHKELKELAL
jgi:hypothetical protein